MEYYQFGNTELSICQVKETYSNHTHHDSMDDSSPLEKEFEVWENIQYCFFCYYILLAAEHWLTSNSHDSWLIHALHFSV